MRRFATLLAVALAAISYAQADPEAQARRLLDDARGYLQDGRYKQALDNLQTVVTGFATTSSVDEALLEMGRYYAEVENDAEKARALLEQLAQGHPQSDSAPGAYYQLGLLRLRQATTPVDLDDALAYFDRLQSLYPRSDWVAAALHATGLVHRRAGRLDEALATQRRTSLEYPASDVAGAAQFEVGHLLALLGQPEKAMEEFQQVRNRFPDSAAAQTALERITALLRLHSGERARFRRDAGWSLGAGDALRDVRAMLVDPSGRLWLASDKVGGAVPFDAQGRMGASLRGDDLRTLSLLPGGDVLLATRYGVKFGAETRSFGLSRAGNPPEPIDRILAAAQNASREWLVSDEKAKIVHRFDAGGARLGSFPDDREREVVRILVDGEGGIVWLDKRARALELFDVQGRRQAVIGPRGAGYELAKPSDIAVDPFRNIYVADEQGGVFVLAPDGRLLATPGQGELKMPTALALDATGALLVYDGKDRQVVRYH